MLVAVLSYLRSQWRKLELAMKFIHLSKPEQARKKEKPPPEVIVKECIQHFIGFRCKHFLSVVAKKYLMVYILVLV